MALTSLYEIQADIEYRERAEMPTTQEEIDEYFERLKALRSEGEKSYHRAVGND